MAHLGNSTLTRASLGQVASLGDLYNARRDTFCGTSIFKRNIPNDAVKETGDQFSDIRLVHKDTLSEKFSKLDVKAELQVSVLAGLFTLEGSGRYLDDHKTSARSVKSSLLYNVKTVDEKLNIYHEDLKDAFSTNAITSGEATHVVVGISWGANCVLTCEYRNTDNKDVKEIEGNLSAQMKKIKTSLSISGNASVDFNERDNNKGNEYDIRIFGDIVPRNQDLPTTVDAALDLMRQMPHLVATSNNGRGKPLTYVLIPISQLQNYLDFPIMIDSVIRTLEESTLKRVVQMFEQIAQLQQEIYDFVNDANDYKGCLLPIDITNINQIKNELSIQESKFRSKLANLLVAVRSGTADVAVLEELINQYQSDIIFSPNKFMESRALIGRKISFAKLIISNNVAYIGYGDTLDDEIDNHFDSKSYILYFKETANTSEAEKWKLNRQLFLQEIKKGKVGCKYFAVDCDIHTHLWPKHGTCIHVVQNGTVQTDNLVEDRINHPVKTQKEVTCASPFAQSSLLMVKIPNKQNNRVNLAIPCAGTACPRSEHFWICPKCKRNIEYGFDSHFYCSCGRAAASSYEFKCPNTQHGAEFKKHEETFLHNVLSQLRPYKEINILIFGETGVGKSTWINGFKNYLNFATLEEALQQDELLTIVSSKFTTYDYDQHFNEIIVSTGIEKNESAKKETRIYTFPACGSLIRLIDTPVLGDGRGVDQNEIDFKEVFETISHLDEIHGICILLKSNNSGLTSTFISFIDEFLSYLHRDARKNIMFCFTNSRGTFYRPGETLSSLKLLLEENESMEIGVATNTVYCYDSEAYRLLAAVKNKPNPVNFDDDDKKDFEISWKKSVSESRRMIEQIRGLIPHAIQDTLKLNRCRRNDIFLNSQLSQLSDLSGELQILKRLAITQPHLQPRNIQWIPMSQGQHPHFATQAGIDSGKELFVARASHNGGLIPGKLHDGHTSAHIAYGGLEIPKPNYEVLIAPIVSLSWVDAQGQNIPPNAVVGGNDPNGEPLYIGRVWVNNTITLGKVQLSHGLCYVPYGGKEIAHSSYEILVKNALGRALGI